MKRLIALVLLVLGILVLCTGTALAAASSSDSSSVSTGDGITAGVGLIALAAFCKAVTGFIKVLRHQDWNAVGTTAVWWAAGIVVVVVFAHTQWGTGIDLFGTKLSDAGTGELLVLGIVGPGSIGVAWNEDLKAKDRSDSAAQPPMFAKGASVPPSGVDPDFVGVPPHAPEQPST